MLLCCLLEVNWVRSRVVNDYFVEVHNGGVDGLYFDVLHNFSIWHLSITRWRIV